jgi:hypothetical protein
MTTKEEERSFLDSDDLHVPKSFNRGGRGEEQNYRPGDGAGEVDPATSDALAERSARQMARLARPTLPNTHQ